jgi:hypothetical protein
MGKNESNTRAMDPTSYYPDSQPDGLNAVHEADDAAAGRSETGATGPHPGAQSGSTLNVHTDPHPSGRGNLTPQNTPTPRW